MPSPDPSSVRLDGARILGLTFFLAGLLRYRSFENRGVLGLWSGPFTAIVLTAGALWLGAIARWWTRRRAGGVRRRLGLLEARALNLSVLLWGGAYFLSACESPADGGRILVLDLLGSVAPIPALLEWIALACLFTVLAVRIKALGAHRADLGVFVVAVLLTALTVEGALRLKVAVAPTLQGFPTCSSKAWARRYVRLNHEGFRDADHTLERDHDVSRLLVVGDSFAYGLGIEDQGDRFGEKLAAGLRAATGRSWEPLNAAQCDTHTLDHIRVLKRMRPYRPDLVLLLYVFNDIDYLAPVTPRYGATSSSIWGRINPLWVLYRNSYLVQEVLVRGRLIAYRFGWIRKLDPYLDASLVSRHLDDVARFVAEAAATAGRVLVVPIDPGIVKDEPTRRRYVSFISSLSERGIPVCDLADAFDGAPHARLVVNALDAHPSELAHRLASDAVLHCLTSEAQSPPGH